MNLPEALHRWALFMVRPDLAKIRLQDDFRPGHMLCPTHSAGVKHLIPP